MYLVNQSGLLISVPWRPSGFQAKTARSYLHTCFKPIFHCDAKPFTSGPGVGSDPQHHNFALEIPICWYLKTLKLVLPPTPTPNASRWIIGGVGSPTQNSRVGPVDIMLFVSISFA